MKPGLSFAGAAVAEIGGSEADGYGVTPKLFGDCVGAGVTVNGVTGFNIGAGVAERR